ncbi:SpoIIE family protein phosphatase [Shewanella fidelis]|uniref:SpoIIE family protein phosphatase n=1 Tax=Shewanella fidelis TaxID=173509 RepID=A0AAW8NMG9_9GAMM|nr:SpoIIE family protein phosphatase [Shewanella fidelis]MDR8524398.1 SpoIIE family protein phosphatase [Shewanella fidelis]MDW4811875.1 SpoIIE family protein phosphatase [Shewanella fidelis]MDW4817186.1 SpoIIE family protein phosphatase [Shewanella fidelis]MDW4821256.1 SpoIIE family protein phosphatase [Shewanella fidelis]MDW4822480.1 SpoIIE family protein phosphatase [Shewanella fidelis]
MSLAQHKCTHSTQQHRILVVEDCDSERLLLTNLLRSLNHQVISCANPYDAINYLKHNHVEMVITDWMMPNISGVELCKTIKSSANPPYTILLTSKNQNDNIIEGLASGADDFIAKPFHSGVLQVRVLAGLRIIEMQQQLSLKNQALNLLLAKEQQYSKNLKQDLHIAAELQQALLPKNNLLSQGWRVNTRFKPAQDLAGDLFQCFEIDEQRIGFYLLDVSGHGTAASMLSFNLAHCLSPTHNAWQSGDICSLVNQINHQFEDPQQTGRFATLLLGIINTSTNQIELVNAGHPSPILVTEEAASLVSQLDTNNNSNQQLPIGIDHQYQYQSYSLDLPPASQLLLYSDGIYECRNSKYGYFGQQKLLKNINEARQLPAEQLLHFLTYSAELWQEKTAQDDISLMLISSASSAQHSRQH